VLGGTIDPREPLRSSRGDLTFVDELGGDAAVARTLHPSRSRVVVVSLDRQTECEAANATDSGPSGTSRRHPSPRS
jgi:hypothetical protein